MYLFEALAQHIAAWREGGYEYEDYPAISEILDWAKNLIQQASSCAHRRYGRWKRTAILGW